MNIYVGNLNYKVRDEVLREAFEEYGEVTTAKVVMDRETGRSRGFGFVEMAIDSEASNAIEELNGAELMGREIRVSMAKPRQDNTNNNRRKKQFQRER
jgi:RNA recognition motif-containing protein